MKYFPAGQFEFSPVDRRHFVGNAAVARLLPSAPDTEVRIYRVAFEPGGRTNWHIHTGIQLLCVEQGEGRFQRKGGDIVTIRAGDVVHVDPREVHWHGAGPETAMTHVAINFGGGTEWMDPVSEEEYA